MDRGGAAQSCCQITPDRHLEGLRAVATPPPLTDLFALGAIATRDCLLHIAVLANIWPKR